MESSMTPIDGLSARSARKAVDAAGSAEPTPVVVALMGLPGAGKSVVAQALAEKLRLRRVCRDAIRQALFPQCSYSFAENAAAFRTVILALEINCLLGESTVLDGMTFARRSDLERVDTMARQFAFTMIPVYLDCPPDVASARIANDVEGAGHPARNRTPDLVYQVKARFNEPPRNALVINANQPAADVCRIALDAVAQIRGVRNISSVS
jgi:predicted kinase